MSNLAVQSHIPLRQRLALQVGLLRRWLEIDNWIDDAIAPLDLVQATHDAVEGRVGLTPIAAPVTIGLIKIGSAGEALPDDATKWAAVYDSFTGLMYSADLRGEEKPWSERASALEDFTCAGFSDWRVASRRETLAIIDDSRHSPAVDTRYFRFPESGWVWTDTPWAAAPESYAWGVGLYDGCADDDHQDDEGLVLPVRGPVPSPGQF